MVHISALFFMDLKGKILISRNYRGDVDKKQAEKCVLLLLPHRHRRRRRARWPLRAAAPCARDATVGAPRDSSIPR